MALDSDVTNADSHLHVEFYHYRSLLTKRWPNRDAAKQEDSLDGKPFVRITVPGDKNNTVMRPVRESDKERFPRQWMQFSRDNAEGEIVGTLLTTWNKECSEDLTIAQMESLHVLKFDTVEQIANASDGHLQRVGMGGVGLRERAKAYLAAKSAQAGSTEFLQMKNELAELKAMLSANRSAPDAPKKRGPKPGYKKVKPNVDNHDAAVDAASHG